MALTTEGSASRSQVEDSIPSPIIGAAVGCASIGRSVMREGAISSSPKTLQSKGDNPVAQNPDMIFHGMNARG